MAYTYVQKGDERVLNDDIYLISETDDKGRILFANDAFCEIAGYRVEELIGKPHNIVRHPDMPRAAFKDLWETIQSNKEWTGFVKNRTKDGRGYYWVYATVFPLMRSGKRTYISIRKKPTEDEITASEALYRTLN